VEEPSITVPREGWTIFVIPPLITSSSPATVSVICCHKRREVQKIFFDYLSVYLSIYVCLSVYLPAHLPTYPPIHPSIYPSVCLSVCLCMAVQPFVGLGLFFSFLILYTVGSTPWTDDQPVAWQLPTHRTTQTQNKRIYRHPCLEWYSNPLS
jgi:hypothetical protein